MPSLVLSLITKVNILKHFSELCFSGLFLLEWDFIVLNGPVALPFLFCLFFFVPQCNVVSLRLAQPQFVHWPVGTL